MAAMQELVPVIEGPAGVLLKSSESVGYCWEFDELPKNSITRTKRIFNTEICGHSTTWSLRLTYDPRAETLINLFSIDLVHHGKSTFNVTPFFTAILLHNNKAPVLVEEKGHCSRISGDWEYFNFKIDTKKIRFYEILDYRLKLEISITYNQLEPNKSHVLWDKMARYPYPYEDLKEGLDEDKENSDLEIITKTERYKVSRDVLAGRSITFYSTYEYERIQGEKVLHIDDVDADLVREMLRYFYTGRVRKIDKIAGDLLVLADRYKIPLLKAMCEKSLVKQLKPENVDQMLRLARRYQLVELKEKAEGFRGDSSLEMN